MISVLACLAHDHKPGLLLLAVAVCIVGVYASFAVATYAHRSSGRARLWWRTIAVLASGCTAWATHFIALLSYMPGMPAGFEPLRTAASLLAAIAGIGTGVAVVIGRRGKRDRFLAGVTIGVGITALHYIGQSAYQVAGTVSWDLRLVGTSVLVSLGLCGMALMTVAERNRWARQTAAPLLIAAIALLHFCGMAAMTLHPDPHVVLRNTISPHAFAPIVAGVCLSLLALAVIGWRLDLVAKRQVRKDRDRLRALADVALEGLLICDGDRIVTANSAIQRLCGFDCASLAGSFVSTLLPSLDVPSLPEREEREAEILNQAGELVPVRVLRSEVPLGHRPQTVIAVRDQSERLRTEAKMRSLAFGDPLTGLANRTRFFDLLENHAASRRASETAYAVLMVDLDRFKPINDTLGHAAGDIVLRKVADRLRAIVRDSDVVARLGGDEFAILQLDPAAAKTASALAGRIVHEIAGRPFRLDGHAIHLGVSIGIASAPDDGDDPAELLHKADLALYAAKADGKGRFRLYDPLLDAQSQKRRAMESGLRNAITNGGLELHYQPLLDSATGQVVAAEALVRWRCPDRGLVPPGDFIPLAEETGLILPLGAWVMKTACAAAARWPETIGIAVNLSPAQLRDPKIVEGILAVLADTALDPARLELEITESVLISDEKRTLETLQALRATGVRIAMDDFGTGYSSLSYLRRFPFSRIKIDQSFVRQISQDASSAAIVRAIITMSKCLGMSTTVEGVETKEQLEFAVSEGCDRIQGYLISRPLRDGDFRAFLGLPRPATGKIEAPGKTEAFEALRHHAPHEVAQ